MKKFKKIIFLACFVMLIAVMAIAVSAASAYDTTRTVDVDLTKLPEVTTVNGEIVSGDSVKLPLYKDNGDGTFDALTWYVADTTNLVSIATKDIMYLDSQYLKFNNDGKSIRANIVVFNVQDDTIDSLRSTNVWGSPTNAGIQSSAYLQYIYFGDKTTKFNESSTFQGCTNLKGVYFTTNSELTDIQNRTFGGCSGLTEVTLPPKLKTIGSAFRETGLTTISIPASVTSINYTFYNCASLEEVVFADGSKLTVIDEQTFEGCSKLPSINIPDGVTKIGKRAFYGCKLLPSISLNNVIEIGESAFCNCTSLTKVDLPKIKTIGNYAFKGCTGLTTVSIPSSALESLGTQIFMNCSSLKEVTFADVCSLETLSDSVFENCIKLTSLNIPDGVTKIGNRAFYGCTLLPSISLNNVTEIGEFAFRSCTSLTKVDLPKIKTIGNYAFKGCSGLATVTIPSSDFESFGIEVFRECTSLESIVLAKEAKLTAISKFAFYKCESLKSITLPNSVTTIGFSSFGHCYALEYVNLGASVTTFETDGTNCNAFYDCHSLKTLIMPATIKLTGTEKQLFEKASKTIKFFFTGTKEQVDELKTALTKATNNTPFTNIADANIVEYNSETDYSSMSGAYIIYNYNHCEAFYGGEHTFSENPVLAYSKGFDQAGTSTCTCTRVECGYSKTTVIDPIFVALGYSTNNDGTAIYGGFTVDTTALANYNAYVGAGKELKYGIVVVNVGLDANLAFGTNGIVSSDKAIQVEINDTSFSRFGFTLTGFNDENGSKALNLVISAYVIDGNNMSFVQSGTSTDTAYYVTSVDAIVGEDTKGKLGVITFTKISSLA